MAVISKTSYVIADVITGERVGRSIAAEVPQVLIDVIVGERYGLSLIADTGAVIGDHVIGERYGRNILMDVPQLMWDVVIAEANTRVSTVLMDVVASVVEPVGSIAQVKGLQEEVVRERPKPDPTTVLSDMISGNYHQQVTQVRIADIPRSGIFTQTARMQLAQLRFTTNPASVWSFVRYSTLRELVVRSRNLVTPSVSAVFVSNERQEVTQHRDTIAAPAVRSQTRIGNVRELVLVSRQAAVVDIDDQAATLRELVLQGRTVEQIVSEMRAGTLAQLTVQQRIISTVVDDQAGSVQQVVVQAREQVEPRSQEEVGSVMQVTVQGRQVVEPFGDELITQVMQTVALTRLTAPPSATVGMWAYTERQLVALRLVRPAPLSLTRVGSLRVQYTLGRDTVPPWEVIDPSIGRHTASLHSLTVMHRDTEPPANIEGQMRTVFSLEQRVVARDGSFPPPPTEPDVPVYMIAHGVNQQIVSRDVGAWEPVSTLVVDVLIQQSALSDADGWADPTIPNSFAEVHQALQQPALSDESFPPSTQPQSAAEVVQALQHAALLDESFPPGTEPQSLVDVLQALQQPALLDDSFPPGTEPQSVAEVFHVAQSAAKRDLSISGVFPASPVDVTGVGLAVVQRDLTMNHMPSRPRGPRPRVSIVRS